MKMHRFTWKWTTSALHAVCTEKNIQIWRVVGELRNGPTVTPQMGSLYFAVFFHGKTCYRPTGPTNIVLHSTREQSDLAQCGWLRLTWQRALMRQVPSHCVRTPKTSWDIQVLVDIFGILSGVYPTCLIKYIYIYTCMQQCEAMTCALCGVLICGNSNFTFLDGVPQSLGAVAAWAFVKEDMSLRQQHCFLRPGTPLSQDPTNTRHTCHPRG